MYRRNSIGSKKCFIRWEKFSQDFPTVGENRWLIRSNSRSSEECNQKSAEEKEETEEGESLALGRSRLAASPCCLGIARGVAARSIALARASISPPLPLITPHSRNASKSFVLRLVFGQLTHSRFPLSYSGSLSFSFSVTVSFAFSRVYNSSKENRRGRIRDAVHERTLEFPFPFSLSLSTDGPGYILGSRHDERDDTREQPNRPESRPTAETRAAATPDGQRILLEHTVTARRAHSPRGSPPNQRYSVLIRRPRVAGRRCAS